MCESECALETHKRDVSYLKMAIIFYCLTSMLFKIYSSSEINANGTSNSIAKVKFSQRKLSKGANYV